MRAHKVCFPISFKNNLSRVKMMNYLSLFKILTNYDSPVRQALAAIW